MVKKLASMKNGSFAGGPLSRPQYSSRLTVVARENQALRYVQFNEPFVVPASSRWRPAHTRLYNLGPYDIGRYAAHLFVAFHMHDILTLFPVTIFSFCFNIAYL